ncbi:MAG: LamG-like jellyroll fold domain-containing protein [Methanoregula sp.]|nr:LamG-like jellyroll fold domain-containing protein [Methanoregula sp.]
MNERGRESALSPIIAEILMIALILLVAVIAYVFFFQLPLLEKIPMVAVDITKNGSQVFIFHKNGDSLENGTFYVTVNGDRITDRNVSLTGGAYPWSSGEQLVVNYSGTSAIREVKLIYAVPPISVVLASVYFSESMGNITPVNTTPIYIRYPGFTVESWVKWNVLPNPNGDASRNWATIVVDGNTDNNRRYQLQHDQLNNFFEFARQKNSGGMTYMQSTTHPSMGSWYYVVGVYNQTPGTMSIFVNGVRESGVNTGGVDISGLRPSPNIYQVGSPAGITFNSNANQRRFDGTISGLKTYEEALSQAEIVAHYTTGIP